MCLWNIAAVDTVHGLNERKSVLPGVAVPVLLDVRAGRADDVNVDAESTASAEVQHQGRSSFEDERAAGASQGLQEGESTDDFLYKYGIGGVMDGRSLSYPLKGSAFR